MEQVAPRTWRIGSTLVNRYIVVDGSSIVLVDGGLPACWPDLVAGLETLATHVLPGHGVPWSGGAAEAVAQARAAAAE